VGASVLVCVVTQSVVMRRAAIQEISLLHALQLIAANDDAVKNHLEQPAMRNCTYKSPKIQKFDTMYLKYRALKARF